MKPDLSLEDQFKELHEKSEAVVAAYVDKRAAQVPGVPRGSVEASILGRANGDRYEEYRIVRALQAAEEKLAKQQSEKADALPEG
jgi:hypothetical protein